MNGMRKKTHGRAPLLVFLHFVVVSRAVSLRMDDPAPDPPAPAPAGNPGVTVRDGPPTDPNLREVGTSATWTVGTAKVSEKGRE
jgi:hypothetical protein